MNHFVTKANFLSLLTVVVFAGAAVPSAHAANRYAKVDITNKTPYNISFTVRFENTAPLGVVLTPGESRFYYCRVNPNQPIHPNLYIDFDGDLSSGSEIITYWLTPRLVPDLASPGTPYEFVLDGPAGAYIDLKTGS